MLLELDPAFVTNASQVDRSFLLSGLEREDTKLPAGARGIPTWAPEGVENLRGLVPVSNTHYHALVSLMGKLVEVMLDPGGARTMIDRATAIALGLNIEWADANKSFGTFSGVSATPSPYLGIARGPVELRFGEDVVFFLDEIKVFDYPDPIIIVGTDLLGHSSKGPCTFAYLGVNPKSLAGEIIFYKHTEDKMMACELVNAPLIHTSKHVLPPPTMLTGDTNALAKD